MVNILVERGEIRLSEDLYIDGTTIRSKAARRKIKWRSNYERYSACADEAIHEAVNELLDQVEHGDSGEDSERQGHVDRYTPEQARRIADEIEERAREEWLRNTDRMRAI